MDHTLDCSSFSEQRESERNREIHLGRDVETRQECERAAKHASGPSCGISTFLPPLLFHLFSQVLRREYLSLYSNISIFKCRLLRPHGSHWRRAHPTLHSFPRHCFSRGPPPDFTFCRPSLGLTAAAAAAAPYPFPTPATWFEIKLEHES